MRGFIKGETPWPLLVCGPAGIGKTCAGLALLDYSGGEYHTVQTLCETMNQSKMGELFWPGGGSKIFPERLRNLWRGAAMFVLDEIGTREKVSDAAYETVKELIELRHNRPFMVLSNLSLERIAAVYDSRILSRLSCGTTIELAGPDRRLEQ